MIDSFLTSVSNRPFLQRWLYHDDDRESLRTFKESLADAKMDYLVLIFTFPRFSVTFTLMKFSSMLLIQRDRQEAKYRVYSREELEFAHVVKLGPVRHEIAYLTRREGSAKVLVRRYSGASKQV
jgi:hypothetical protein